MPHHARRPSGEFSTSVATRSPRPTPRSPRSAAIRPPVSATVAAVSFVPTPSRYSPWGSLSRRARSRSTTVRSSSSSIHVLSLMRDVLPTADAKPSRRERAVDDVVQLAERKPLAPAAVRHHRGIEGLVRGDQSAEQPRQHLGIALAQDARPLAPLEQRGLKCHRVVVALFHGDVDLSVARERRGARVAKVEPPEVRVLAKEPDLEVDEGM